MIMDATNVIHFFINSIIHKALVQQMLLWDEMITHHPIGCSLGRCLKKHYSGINRTKSKNLNVSHLILHLFLPNWSQVLSWKWRCSWSSADRQCSSNIWVINNLTTAVFFNSLAPGKFEWNFRHVIFKQSLVIDGWCISCEIALLWMSMDFTDDQSTLVQVMAWCCQATSHYLSQCLPRYLSPYGVTRPQWFDPREFQLRIEINIFQCLEKIFCVQFQRYSLKFHTKYLIPTLEDMHFIQNKNFIWF